MKLRGKWSENVGKTMSKLSHRRRRVDEVEIEPGAWVVGLARESETAVGGVAPKATVEVPLLTGGCACRAARPQP